MNATQLAACKAYIEKFEPNYRGLLEQLAEEAHRVRLAELEAYGFNPDATEYKRWVARHLDCIVAAYVGWQGVFQSATLSGCPLDDESLLKLIEVTLAKDPKILAWLKHWKPVDDTRLLELIEPHVKRESDRRMFLAMCKRIWQDQRELQGLDYSKE